MCISKERLLYPNLHRRQFLLSDVPHVVACGPEGDVYSDWRRLTIGNIGAGRLSLSVHPELQCIQRSSDELELTLLGFLIDPARPNCGDGELLDQLLNLWSLAAQRARSFEQTERFGGRWILVVHQSGRTVILNDASGMRQLYYTDETIPQFLCASQPSLIAKALNLQPDRRAQQEFVESEVRSDREYWWPGDISLYRGVRHLLPNHFLTVEDGFPRRRTVTRFWPCRKLRPVAKEEAVAKASSILRGQWAGAAARFPLAQSITAGIDSRTVFAAGMAAGGPEGQDFCRDVYYYTMMFGGMSEKSPDVRVPARLLSRFGLDHHAVATPEKMASEFAELYRQNVTLAHDRWGKIMDGLRRVYPEDRVAVDGTVSEIARCFYYKKGAHPARVTAEMLADLTGMSKTPLILEAFDHWLQEGKAVEDRFGVPVLDLFYWEQRVGNWAAAALTELDIVQETFTPFNHRELLTTLLSVDIKWRCWPRYDLYRQLIRSLWPEGLSEPINPTTVKQQLATFKRKLKRTALASLQRVGLEQVTRRAYRALRGAPQ